MRRFVRPRAFDAAVSLSTSFGYFEDPDDDGQVLRNLCGSLKEGGRLVVQMMGKEAVARDFRPKERFCLDDGVTIEEDRSLSGDGTRFEKRRRVIVDGRVEKEFEVSHRLYSAADLADLLRRCGFESVEVFGDLARAPCDERARELVVLATR
jgi:SAM-dependent methyltransferase